MDSISPEQRKAQQQAGNEDRVQYVEELASAEEYPPGDAWISLTDAARVTRTSEAMARRWVTSGRIKVKKDPVGVPPRTRLVRLSDVAKIRPIVDPTAAITGEVRKLDLASIPRQQLQIMEEHQRFMEQAEALQQTIVSIRTQVQQDLQAVETELTEQQDQLRGDFEQQLIKVDGRLTALFNDLAGQITQRSQDLQRNLQEASEHLEGVQKDQQKHIDNLYQEKNALLKMHINDTKEIRQGLTTEGQAREQLGRDLVEAEQRQQAELERQAQELRQLLEQQKVHLQEQLEALEQSQGEDVATLTARMDTLAEDNIQMSAAIKNVKALVEGSQHRIIAQERRMDTLQYELEQEREARNKLEQRLQAEQKERELLTQRLQVLVQSVNALHVAAGEKPAGKQKKV